MASRPVELGLSITPVRRFDATDVAGLVRDRFGDVLDGFPRVLYCSLHTTAGYFEQGLARRLQHRRERLDPFVGAFRGLFPAGASYLHDQLHLRRELSLEQCRTEPRNGDSHLAFIGAGLSNCVSYLHHPGEPVYLVDLDGVNGDVRRTRLTRILGYRRERVVAKVRIAVPVSRHPIDSVNLADHRLGIFVQAQELARRHGVEKGRFSIGLVPSERDAGVTVNEYETLLMRHDLAEVLADPFRFVARSGRRMLADPRSVPAKSLGYARYDLVHVFNELMDALKLSESTLERLVARVMAMPARRLLRLKRSVSMLVSDAGCPGEPDITHGTYQRPIMIQWASAAAGSREVELSLTSLT
jgi:hypothetical protein